MGRRQDASESKAQKMLEFEMKKKKNPRMSHIAIVK